MNFILDVVVLREQLKEIEINEVPLEKGGIIDDLEEFVHRRGGNHTRHTKQSDLSPAQRAKEIREYWIMRGKEYILPGEYI